VLVQVSQITTADDLDLDLADALHGRQPMPPTGNARPSRVNRSRRSAASYGSRDGSSAWAEPRLLRSTNCPPSGRRRTARPGRRSPTPALHVSAVSTSHRVDHASTASSTKPRAAHPTRVGSSADV
jgi:hypothetical protein